MTDNENQSVETKVEDSAQAVETKTVEPEQLQQVDPEKVGKAFAGVKKEYRQKGYSEGYEAAKTEFSSQQPKVEEKEPQPKVDSHAIDVDSITDKAVEKLKQQQLDENVRSVNRKGLQKYDDFQDLLNKADERSRRDPTFASLGWAAYKTNSPDVVRKILTDEATRRELLDMHPDKWDVKFSEMMSNKVDMPKIAPDPIEPVTGTPSSGTVSKTHMDRRKELFNRYETRGK